MHMQAQLVEKTGLAEILDGCDLSIAHAVSAVINVPMITRALYFVEDATVEDFKHLHYNMRS